MMHKEAVFLRKFSELEELQQAYTLQYGFIANMNAAKPYGIVLQSYNHHNKMTSECIVANLYEEYDSLLLLLQFLYENAVSPACLNGILQDLSIITTA